MEERPDKGRKTGNLLKLLLKIVVSVACLWYVSGKIDFSKAAAALREAHVFYLLLAFILFVASKIISAIRLNIYFRNIGIHMPRAENLRLYWLGMFYNLFLPGSISGDAYKVILLTRKHAVPYRQTTAAVLLDRLSGLLGLGILLAGYGLLLLSPAWYGYALTGVAVISIFLLWFITVRFFPAFLPGFLPTLWLGILVQAVQVACVYSIMAALGIPAAVTEYVFIFLLSSIASVLPLTIGGLGIRELVFLEGSRYFGLQEESSVVISILFYLITLLASSWGMVYVFKGTGSGK